MHPQLRDTIIKSIREQHTLGDAAPPYDKRPYSLEQLEFVILDLAGRFDGWERSSSRMELARGWHLISVDDGLWMVCDPEGDRLGGTDKHQSEFGEAVAAFAFHVARMRTALTEIANNPSSDPEGNSQIARRALLG